MQHALAFTKEFQMKEYGDNDIAQTDISGMVSFTFHSVPAYLIGSEFYECLESNDDTISIPSDVYKPNLLINSRGDLRHLLSTIRFWGVKIIPAEIISFVVDNLYVDVKAQFEEFIKEIKFLGFLELLSERLQSVRRGLYESRNVCTPLRIEPRNQDLIEKVVKLLCTLYENTNKSIWSEDACALAAASGWVESLAF